MVGYTELLLVRNLCLADQVWSFVFKWHTELKAQWMAFMWAFRFHYKRKVSRNYVTSMIFINPTLLRLPFLFKCFLSFLCSVCGKKHWRLRTSDFKSYSGQNLTECFIIWTDSLQLVWLSETKNDKLMDTWNYLFLKNIFGVFSFIIVQLKREGGPSLESWNPGSCGKSSALVHADLASLSPLSL